MDKAICTICGLGARWIDIRAGLLLNLDNRFFSVFELFAEFTKPNEKLTEILLEMSRSLHSAVKLLV